MKKLILFAAILFAGVSVVKAEDEGGPIAEGVINLTLKLQPFQSIVIGGGGDNGSTSNNVVLNYETAEDYEKGVTTTMTKHLTIVAAGKYTVEVEAKSGVFSDGLEPTSYDLSNITLTAKATDGAEDGSTIDLSEGLQTLITSDVGTTGEGVTYDVDYKGAGGNQYVAMLKGNEETTYTTEITYTISAK